MHITWHIKAKGVEVCNAVEPQNTGKGNFPTKQQTDNKENLQNTGQNNDEKVYLIAK